MFYIEINLVSYYNIAHNCNYLHNIDNNNCDNYFVNNFHFDGKNNFHKSWQHLFTFVQIKIN